MPQEIGYEHKLDGGLRMKLPITKEWLKERAAAGGDFVIGAGRHLTKTMNPSTEGIAELEHRAFEALPAWARTELTSLRGEVARFRLERSYVIGCKDGFEIAIEQAVQLAEAEPEFEDEPGPDVVRAMLAVGPIKNARTAYSVTKASIAKAIRALATSSKPSDVNPSQPAKQTAAYEDNQSKSGDAHDRDTLRTSSTALCDGQGEESSRCLAAFDGWTEIPGVEHLERAADACRLLIEAYMHNPEQVDWSDIQIALDAALEAFGLPEDYPEKAFAAQHEDLS